MTCTQNIPDTLLQDDKQSQLDEMYWMKSTIKISKFEKHASK